MKRVGLAASVLFLVAGMAWAANETATVQPPVQQQIVQFKAPETAAGDSLFDTFSYMRLKRGDVTWSGAANFMAPSSSDQNSSFNFNAAVGYFATDYIELELGMLWADSGDSSGMRVSGGVNRYFGEWTENLFPYVGAALSTWTGDLSEQEGTHFLVKGGIRHYISRHAGLRYWIEYDMNTESDSFFAGYIGVFAHPF